MSGAMSGVSGQASARDLRVEVRAADAQARAALLQQQQLLKLQLEQVNVQLYELESKPPEPGSQDTGEDDENEDSDSSLVSDGMLQHKDHEKWLKDGFRPLQIQPDAGVYDSVVVAAFTGVEMQLQGGLEHLKVHPFPLWLASIGLFACQATLLGAVVLEIDQKKFLLSCGDPKTFLTMRSVVKALLMMIVQVQLLRDVRHSVEMLLFVLHPSTWMDRIEPVFKFNMLFSWTYSNAWMMAFVPLCWMACLCKFLTASYVTVASISIVYTAPDLTNAIFNSLALSFVVSLDAAFWQVLAINFNIKHEDNFEFKSAYPTRCKCKTAKKFYSLTDSFGMSALLSRRTLVSVLLTSFYFKQVLYVLFVRRTAILPTTIDVCSAWKLVARKENMPLSWKWQAVGPLARVVLQPFHSRLQDIAVGSNPLDNRTYTIQNLTDSGKDIEWAVNTTGGICHGEALDFFLSSQGIELIGEFPGASATGFSVAILFVLAPILIDFTSQFSAEKYSERWQSMMMLQ